MEEGNLTFSNFYSELLKWDETTEAALAVNVILTVLGPLLLYCEIWYEQNCASMIQQTIINQV
jgi:hypothetical protein